METQEYTLKHNQMITYQLERRGITDDKVLDVFRKVPRHKFVDPFFQNVAYEDHPLSIGEGQTISQPYIVALMTQALDIRPSDKVLEIGTGSGYQTAILTHLSDNVHSIESVEALHEKAKKNLEEQDIDNVNLVHADGKKGLPSEAPFDKIIVTAATGDVPKPLLEQLKVGGCMVVPIGSRLYQELTLITKKDTKCDRQTITLCRFVPLK